MSTRNTGAAVSCTMLSPAELAVPVDEDLVALMAASCPHGRAEHVSPSPDVQYPVGDQARYGAAGQGPMPQGPRSVIAVSPAGYCRSCRFGGRLGRC